MPSTQSISVNLGLPATPATTNIELLTELIRVYNAINILAQIIDQYTSQGSVASAVTAIQADLVGVDSFIQGYVDNNAALAELTKVVGGGTGASTGTGLSVKQTTPTINTPILNTPAVHNLTITDIGLLLNTLYSMGNNAGVGLGTLTNAPAAGNPTKWIAINDAGISRYIPCW
jgi:hypothetical protein